MGIGKWLWNDNARELVSGVKASSKAGARKAADACRPTAEKLAHREIPGTEGLTLEKLNSPQGRKATGKLALDLTRITGKVAVAGAAGAAGFLASMVDHYPSEKAENDSQTFGQNHVWSGPLDIEDGFHTFGPDGPGYYQGGYNLDDE